MTTETCIPNGVTCVSIGQWDPFGNFGKGNEGWVILWLITIMVGGYFLGRKAGLKGPEGWFGVWFTIFLMGLMLWGRALGGYFLLGGAAGSYSTAAWSTSRWMRKNHPDPHPPISGPRAYPDDPEDPWRSVPDKKE